MDDTVPGRNAPTVEMAQPAPGQTAPVRRRYATSRTKAPARWAVVGATTLSFAWFWGAVHPSTAVVTGAAASNRLVAAGGAAAGVAPGAGARRGERAASPTGRPATASRASGPPSRAPSTTGQSNATPRLRTRGS